MRTEQEEFWAGNFGDQYSDRVVGEGWISSNLAFFSDVIKKTVGVESILELGCNIGLNLIALQRLNPKLKLSGVEINEKAFLAATKNTNAQIHHKSILDILPLEKSDLVFTKYVLIHINPDMLNKIYENIYNLSKKYILICEDYNPVPTVVNYRGNEEKLFKRDFAGEIIEKYNLKLIDYGFIYKRDLNFPQDDMTWFLLEI